MLFLLVWNAIIDFSVSFNRAFWDQWTIHHWFLEVADVQIGSKMVGRLACSWLLFTPKLPFFPHRGKRRNLRLPDASFSSFRILRGNQVFQPWFLQAGDQSIPQKGTCRARAIPAPNKVSGCSGDAEEVKKTRNLGRCIPHFELFFATKEGRQEIFFKTGIVFPADFLLPNSAKVKIERNPTAVSVSCF